MNSATSSLCQNTTDSITGFEETDGLQDFDVIFIRELKLEARIGAYAEERATPQILEFDLEIGTSTNLACATDQLSDTIDYAEVVAAIRQLLECSQIHLLEALAESVAKLLFDGFGARWVCISVAKEGIVRGAKFVGVRIRRTAMPVKTKTKSGATAGRHQIRSIAIASG